MVGPGKAQEHVQELSRRAPAAILGKHRHIGDIPLVGGHQQPGIADHLAGGGVLRH